MPLIQELANTTTAATPGWALVPDTGFDPSKAAIVPSGARQRQRGRAGNTAAISSKHQAKIAAHVESLKRDAPRDPAIAVPAKGAARGPAASKKMTPAVRKIVSSQKTFTNHLNDQEALLASKQGDASTAPVARRASAKADRAPADAMDVDAPAAADGDAPMFRPAAAAFPPTPEDSDPFYQSGLPSLPPRDEIEALLALPALPFSLAAAAPSQQSTAASRHFCDICNYWGRVRCLSCNARVCGLECKLRHDETRCYPY